MIVQGVPPGFQSKSSRPSPRPGPFLALTDRILTENKQAPPKQRHMAQRIFDRLSQVFGYTGGYTQVKDYVRMVRTRQQVAYVPLA